jgi:heat shock protein HtpX
MALAGALTLAFYALVAYGLSALARTLWANRPALGTVAVAFLLATLSSGYLTYRFGTRRTLAGLDARALPRERSPGLHRLLDRLVGAMDVAPPRLYVARLGEPNALVLGGPTPALVVDHSLFRILEADELEGVLAHELAHLEGRDTLAQALGHALVGTVVGTVALALAPVGALAGGFARGVALLRGEPDGWHRTVPGRLRVALSRALTLLLLGLTLFLRAHSRRRERAADDRAVEVTGRPLALARALAKIDHAGRSQFRVLLRPGNAPADHPLGRLLSTHPPVTARVRRLRERAERDAVDSGRAVESVRRPGRPNRGDDGWTRVPVDE